MALDYSLNIDTKIETETALRILRDKVGLKEVDSKHLSGPAVVVSSIELSSLSQEIVEEGFGFRPKIGVWFRLDPNSDAYEEGKKTMIKASLALLEDEPMGNAVLQTDTEHILMKRIDGQLCFNKEWFSGDRVKELADVKVPYQLQPIPSPFL